MSEALLSTFLAACATALWFCVARVVARIWSMSPDDESAASPPGSRQAMGSDTLEDPGSGCDLA